MVFLKHKIFIIFTVKDQYLQILYTHLNKLHLTAIIMLANRFLTSYFVLLKIPFLLSRMDDCFEEQNRNAVDFVLCVCSFIEKLVFFIGDGTCTRIYTNVLKTIFHVVHTHNNDWLIFRLWCK